MGRPVVLSNGQLFVGLDENGLVHDFYYPYVGLENLATSRRLQHKIGVWIDGSFSWTDDGTWQVSVDFEEDALISIVRMQSTSLQLKLEFQDFIDNEENILIRRANVINQTDKERDIRLFMHQVFQISRGGRADTALFVPDDDYILDYKGRYCLLIAGKFSDNGHFDQFAIGNYGIEGKSGTFQDAEDGELSNNPVEHGGVDSVLRFRRVTKANDNFRVDYWIAAADSQSDARVLHNHLRQYPLDDRVHKVRNSWHKWMNTGSRKLQSIPEQNLPIAKKSALVVKAHCDERGSVLASGDSTIFNFGRDYYCYCWPRDAAYALWPLIRLGHVEEARRFFEFARDTIHKDGYLMHKYQPDRTIGSTWHPLLHGRKKELAIQEDETAIVLYMMGEYWRATRDKSFVENFYRTFIEPCAEFMMNFIDEKTGLPHASYDLWEQQFLTTTYTVSTVIGGLEAAADMADVAQHPDDALRYKKSADKIRSNLDILYHKDGYFVKGFLLQDDGSLEFDERMDISSLYGPHMFAGLSLDDKRMVSTLQVVEDRLFNTSPIGGVIRQEHDGYFLAKTKYSGNPWVVCTMWLAQYYIEMKELIKAEELVAWVIKRSYPSGSLSEQFDPEDGFSIGVTPLVWSHAEYLNTTLDLAQAKLKQE